MDEGAALLVAAAHARDGVDDRADERGRLPIFAPRERHASPHQRHPDSTPNVRARAGLPIREALHFRQRGFDLGRFAGAA